MKTSGDSRTQNHRKHIVLRLQEPVETLEKTVGEDARDHELGVGAREVRDGFVLAKEEEEVLCVGPDDGERNRVECKNKHCSLHLYV